VIVMNRIAPMIVCKHMTADQQHTRRNVLVTGATLAGAAVGGAALTGCDGGTGGGTQPPPRAKPGQPLVALREVPVRGARSATLPDGEEAIVSRPSASTVAAFSAICTHQGCTVAPQGTELHCPCHGSVFDAFTGQVRHGPAQRPLPAIKVTVTGGRVVTA
jgi:Rieske Fe-S protein